MDARRTCTRCLVSKPAGEFDPRRDREGKPRWRRSHCKACTREAGRALSRQRAEENPTHEMFLAARKRARMAGVFEIEEHHIVIPTICPVLGIPLAFGRGRRGPCDASPTLDRIVPARGYVSGNIIVISWRANRLKSDATVDELARIVDWFRTIVETTG